MKKDLYFLGDNEADIDFVIGCLKDSTMNAIKLFWNQEFYISSFEMLSERSMADGIIILCFKDAPFYGEKYISLLSKCCKISKENFVDFYRIYYAGIPYERVKKIMNNPIKGKGVEGIILGISHAEVGIIPERLLDGKFVNLAVSSQDLYSNYKTLCYCYEHHFGQIGNLKYIVLDLFDYTYFNYDVSLGNEIINYIRFNGIADSHNYNYNKNYNYSFESIIDLFHFAGLEGITQYMVDLWECLFDNPYVCAGYEGYDGVDISGRVGIYPVGDIKKIEEMVKKPRVLKRFEKTIEENITNLRKIFELAMKINQDIKILCVIIPRYIKAQKEFEKIGGAWKEEFYSILDKLHAEYKFKFIDYNDSPIAMKREYYYDESHLNCIGAIKFTEIINKALLQFDDK